VLYREWAETVQVEWADAMSKIYITTELLKKDVESSLVRKASYGLLWMLG
jgi:hypothetical protein